MPINPALLKRIRDQDPKLTEVYLSHQTPKLTDSDIVLLCAALKQNNIVRVIELSWNTISDAGAKELAKIQTITELDLRWNEIGDPGVKALAQNTNLNSLFLDFNNVSIIGKQALDKN